MGFRSRGVNSPRAPPFSALMRTSIPSKTCRRQARRFRIKSAASTGTTSRHEGAISIRRYFEKYRVWLPQAWRPRMAADYDDTLRRRRNPKKPPRVLAAGACRRDMLKLRKREYSRALDSACAIIYGRYENTELTVDFSRGQMPMLFTGRRSCCAKRH